MKNWSLDSCLTLFALYTAVSLFCWRWGSSNAGQDNGRYTCGHPLQPHASAWSFTNQKPSVICCKIHCLKMRRNKCTKIDYSCPWGKFRTQNR